MVLVVSGHWFSVSGHLLPPWSVSVQHCIYGSSSSGLLLPNCSSMIILDDVSIVLDDVSIFLNDVPMIPPSSGRCRDLGSTTLMMACCANPGLSTTPIMGLSSPAPDSPLS